ncbi:MAG TPA: hypothetical protein PLX15_04520 [Candidatus Woesearchaeota archaeon]|nr:hypothetical protein [Candidatus Woesearchaeota archaeon]
MRFNNYYQAADAWGKSEPLFAFDRLKGPGENIEGSINPVSRIGTTVTEGQGVGGTFRETLMSAIRLGVRRVELALQMGESQPKVGAESYGKEVRDDIRELAKVNKVKIHSIHTPTAIGNVSGMTREGFSEQQRESELNEIKKAIDFAADVTGGGASIVVHTGEFPRNISDVNQYEKDTFGNKGLGFEGFPGESKEKIHFLVDDRTGQLIKTIKEDQKVITPEWMTKEINGQLVYVDEDDKPVKSLSQRVPKTTKDNKLSVKELSWDDVRKETEAYNRLLPENERIRPEQFVQYSMIDAQQRTAEGYANHYEQGMIEEKNRAINLILSNKRQTEIVKDKELAREVYMKQMDPSYELSKDSEIKLKKIEENIKLSKEEEREIDNRVKKVNSELILGQRMQARELEMMKKHIKPADEFALNKSVTSLAELGIEAFKEGKARKLDEPLFIAPENIFPEMGYGSHPQELIDLVKKSRNRMVEMMTHKEIEGKKNPYFDPSISKEKAERIAKDHIKATFDTQHLGMWYRYFDRKDKPFSSEQERLEEFNKWYLQWVEKMQNEGIIGNVHMLDGFGRGHTHIPLGEGRHPVKTAIHKLLELGYEGNISSEGHEQGGVRQIVKSWSELGSPIYGSYGIEMGPGGMGRARSFSDVHNSYFDKMQSPYFVFGEYAPSKDWSFWSETPLE